MGTVVRPGPWFIGILSKMVIGWRNILSISRVIYRNKDTYESFLYTENDGNDLSYFIQFNLVTMEKGFCWIEKLFAGRLANVTVLCSSEMFQVLTSGRRIFLKFFPET